MYKVGNAIRRLFRSVRECMKKGSLMDELIELQERKIVKWSPKIYQVREIPRVTKDANTNVPNNSNENESLGML